MSFRASGKFILVKGTPPVTETPGGLALPQKSFQDQTSGVVESVGPDAGPHLVGSTIHFRPISTYKVGDLLAVHVDDVLAYEDQ